MNTWINIFSKRRLGIIGLIIAGLLLIPLIAMQFSNAVHWDVFDFVVMGILLLCVGLAYILVSEKIRHFDYKIAVYILIAIIFFLIWAELGVGIFGSPLAGS